MCRRSEDPPLLRRSVVVWCTPYRTACNCMIASKFQDRTMVEDEGDLEQPAFSTKFILNGAEAWLQGFQSLPRILSPQNNGNWGKPV